MLKPGVSPGRRLLMRAMKKRLDKSLKAHSIALAFRLATLDDCRLLAALNHQLIRDEGHRNHMTVPELEQRMHGWLSREYRAVIFEDAGEVVAYGLYREEPDLIYLRQLFVVRQRRRRGIGRRAMEILRSQIWPKDRRLTVEVLVANRVGVAFWRSVGYTDYALSLEITVKQSDHDAQS